MNINFNKNSFNKKSATVSSKLLLLFILVIIVLVACNQAPAETVAPTNTIQATETPIPPTNTPEPTNTVSTESTTQDSTTQNEDANKQGDNDDQGEDEDGLAVDTILYNGKMFTAETNDSWVQALAIKGEYIVATGDDDEILNLATDDTRLIDLEGHTVTPGFNDAHQHVELRPSHTYVLDMGNWVPTDGPEFEEFIVAIEQAVSEIPEGTWIFALIGSNFHDHPDANRFKLDEIAPNHPIWLRNWSGHLGIINTAAMIEVGLAEDEADRFGMFLQRVEGTNIFNGRIEEYGTFLMEGHLRSLMSIEESREQYMAYAQMTLEYGVTTVQDMPVGVTTERAEEILSGMDLPIRWHVICFPITRNATCYTKRTEGMVTYYGTKWVLDGGPIERFAFFRDPYVDEPTTSGHAIFSQEMMIELMNEQLQFSPEEGQLLIHLSGDEIIDRALEALEATGGADAWHGRRVRIEHGDGLLPEHYQQLQDLGIILVQNPLHFSLPDILTKRFGEDRVSIIQPVKSVMEAGIPIAFGSDTEVAGTTFVEIMFAALHPTNPEEALSVAESVRAYTYGSAYAQFTEHEKGTLAPGMLADIVVLSQDIFTIPIEEIATTKSILTIVGGEIKYNADVITTD